MDWKQLISDLLASGMTQTAIGERVGLTQGAISQIANGTQNDVKWSVGQKLRKLHKASSRRKEEQAA